jgi:hypothetical protein
MSIQNMYTFLEHAVYLFIRSLFNDVSNPGYSVKW